MAKWEQGWFGCDSVTGRGKYNHVESCVYVICVSVYICIYHKYTCSNPTDEDYFQILGWSTCKPFLIYAHGAASYGLGFTLRPGNEQLSRTGNQIMPNRPFVVTGCQ